MPDTTIRQAIAEATAQFIQSDSPQLDATLLVTHVLGVSRSYLYAWPEQVLTSDQQTRLALLVAQRARGIPIAYLTGQREFWSLPLAVNPHTLIPRPDTELLVELALAHLPENQPLRVADLGTGSGAIALAIASERPACQVFACDVSRQALDIARYNKHTLQLDNLHLLQANWLTAIDKQSLDMVVSNPPYIAEDDSHLQQGDVRYEPISALVATEHGLACLREIAQTARYCLKPDRMLLMEHGATQGVAVRELLTTAGYTGVQTWSDLAEHDRVSGGRWS